MEFDIIEQSPLWRDLDLKALADTAVRAALSDLSIPADQIELTLLACDDAHIAELNTEFRGKPSPTNVLSWPAEDVTPPDLPEADPDGTIPLGDIAIAYETCAREAEAGGKPLQDHVTHLIVHGLLHLLGYDHVRDIDATVMEGIESRILGKLGLDDPYSVG